MSKAFDLSQAVRGRGITADLGAFRNKIINGNFDIWQRGNLQNANGYRSADRWYVNFNGGTGAVQQVDMALDAFQNAPSYNLALSMAAASANKPCIQQRVEGVRQFSNKKVTLTFYAYTYDGPFQIDMALFMGYGTGGTPSAEEQLPIQSETIPGGEWHKITKVFEIPSVAGKTFGTSGGDYLQIQLRSPASSEYTVHYAHVSLVEGDATAEDDPFSPRHIQQELALCQRYFEVSSGDVQWTQPGSSGIALQRNTTPFAVRKRNTTTVVINRTNGSASVIAASTTHFIVGSAETATTFHSFSWQADAEL
ncbi:hypothetical protein FG152_09785 [Ochrobactrum sp. XJ1]|nr:hypothetical protein [Ochrobactrum sp. XJ1]